jgi:hypothetical protein
MNNNSSLNIHSPLNLTKEIGIISNAIDSLLVMGTPEFGTRFWAKVKLLQSRKADMENEGIGYTAGYSHVSDKEADSFIAQHAKAQ